MSRPNYQKVDRFLGSEAERARRLGIGEKGRRSRSRRVTSDFLTLYFRRQTAKIGVKALVLGEAELGGGKAASRKKVPGHRKSNGNRLCAGCCHTGVTELGGG